MCAHERSAHSGQKKESYPLEAELQLVVSHQIWILQAKLRSSEQAVRILIHWIIFLVLCFSFEYQHFIFEMVINT